MLSIKKKLGKETIKQFIKKNKLISNIKVKFYCNACCGKGYFIISDTVVVCNICSGTGLKYYT